MINLQYKYPNIYFSSENVMFVPFFLQLQLSNDQFLIANHYILINC